MKGQAFSIYNYETVDFFSIVINPGWYKNYYSK